MEYGMMKGSSKSKITGKYSPTRILTVALLLSLALSLLAYVIPVQARSGIPDFIEAIKEILVALDSIEGKLNALPAWGDVVTKNWADMLTDIKGVVGDAVSKLLTTEYFDGVMSGVQEALDSIEDKLNALVGAPIARVVSGSGSNTTNTTTSGIIYTGVKVGTVTVSIGTSGVNEKDESVSIRYYIDPANPTLYITKEVAKDKDTTGWTDTAAAWKVEIVITVKKDTITVNYAYSVITPP